MSFPLQILYRQCRFTLKKLPQLNFERSAFKFEFCCSHATYCNVANPFNKLQPHVSSTVFCRKYATHSDTPQNSDEKKPTPEEKKIGLIKRFKQMAKDYWYVLLPVHGITSILWFGGFYYAVSSGVDVLGAIESLELSDKIMEPLRKSGAGYWALAFACYKVASPLRYAVTLGGTTFAIKRLTTLGWIKPMPSKERIKEVLQEQKENLQDKLIESKQHYQAQMQQTRAQIHEKKEQVIEEMSRYKTELKNIKEKVKKM